MPGANCSIKGCSISRRTKGISIFKIPKASNVTQEKWRNELVNVITRDREIDQDLRRQIKEDRLHICEKHFNTDDMYPYATKKELKKGVLPTQNLPVKSIPRSVVKPRETSSIAKREASAVLTTTVKKNKRQCRDFMDFVKRVSKLKLQNYWSIIENEQDIQIYFTEPEYLISKYQIYVDISLAFSIQSYGWFLNDDHQLYKDCKRTFFNITLNELLAKLQTLQLCKGIELSEIKQADNVQKHVIQKRIRYQQYLATDNQQRKYTKEYQRSLNCEMLLTNEMDICKPCRDNSLKLKHENQRKISKSLEPAKLKAPVSFTSPERLVLTLKQQRLRNKQLEEHIEKNKIRDRNMGKHINESLESDLVTLYSKADSRVVPPFMKLFWEEQQKYLVRRKTGRRYHPMIIKFCLALAAKSSSAYSELRYDPEKGSGVLVLPSLRSLRDYRNYIRPTRGFNPKVVWDLKEKTKEFSEQERYVAILLDEMKIQDDLVWDKHTGELIGFVGLGDPDLNYATLKNTNELATHALVFLIRSIINPLAYSFATFATSGITAFQLFPIFWKAVAILEVTCNMKVIAAVADGASPNRKFFRMHLEICGDIESEFVYRAINLYANETRYIYFFSDVPHLMKTARNCLANSGAGRATRYMWNNGYFIIMNRIADLYYENVDSGLKLLPKLTNEHFKLTSYSVMNVRLAVQVLSSSVGNVLKEFGPPETAGTAKFCLMMDSFFDCLNVRNKEEHKLKRKSNLRPYSDPEDERFELMKKDFIEYFESWKASIDNRPGNFTKQAKSNMFLAWQTYEGFLITVNSFVEATRYLLKEGRVPYVLSERFCQDYLENYFGRQRAIGRRRDNPNVRDVGYNDNTIKSQYSVRAIAGNVQCNYKWNQISTSPLKERKRDDNRI